MVDLAREMDKTCSTPMSGSPDSELAQKICDRRASHAAGVAHVGYSRSQVTLYYHFRRLLPRELEAAGNHNSGPDTQGLGMGFGFNIVSNFKRNGRVIHNLNRLACNPHDDKARPTCRAAGRGGAVKLPKDKRLVPGQATHQNLLVSKYLLGRNGGQAEFPALACPQPELNVARNGRRGTARSHEREERGVSMSNANNLSLLMVTARNYNAPILPQGRLEVKRKRGHGLYSTIRGAVLWRRFGRDMAKPDNAGSFNGHVPDHADGMV